jgi:hypothetical protein
MRHLLALPLLLAALLAAPALAQGVQRVDVPSLLSAQITRIAQRSAAPVLVPSRMPAEHARLYPSGGVNRTGYDLELAAAPHCGGATACFVAAFTAERGGTLAGGRRVALSNGRTGRFFALSCGASCAPPRIEWRERGCLYRIQANVGTRATERREMIRLANSAIINGRRR